VQVGATQKVCQLTGDADHQFKPARPTVSQTATTWGLSGTDNGYSFLFGGKLWFLFGDSPPTPTFNGQPNTQTDSPRTPVDNDAIAFSAPHWTGDCPKLGFVPNSNGAFTSPVVTTAAGQAPVTLRTNEVPIAGVGVNGQMYVIFGTDNPASNPPGGTSSPNGGPMRAVVGVLQDPASLQFKYLYDLSKPPNGRFIFVAIAPGPNGYLYLWGSEGGQTGYRHSPLFLARKRAATIGQPGGMQYFRGFDSHRRPLFGGTESTAVPLFSDAPQCVGEHSVQWNPYVARWVLLYNCADTTATNPRGIWMRTATQAWGPWSAPQTVFATSSGLCAFIHRAVTAANPKCDDLSGPNRMNVQGGDYSPFIIPSFTTGGGGRSTIYYTLSTWNPYQVVIMSTTIKRGSS
jgi:hypothetical protein